jgi:hypothetical protein
MGLRIAVDWTDTVAALQADNAWMPVPGAQRALLDLKRAGHDLVLDGPFLAMLPVSWVEKWVARHYPDTFEAIRDGKTREPIADLRLSGRDWRIGRGYGAVSWADFARLYGKPPD